MKYSIDILKQILGNDKKNLNLTLLATEYINYDTPIKVKCNICNYEFCARLYNILNDHGCNKCANVVRGNKQRFTLEKVKEIIEIENKDLNLEFIDNYYKNNTSPILLKCKICNYIFKGYLSNITKGQSCYKCGRIKSGDKNRFSIEYVKEIVKKYNFELISEDYKSHEVPLILKCKFGHIFEKNLNHIKRGQGCNLCNCMLNLESRKKYVENIWNIFLISHL